MKKIKYVFAWLVLSCFCFSCGNSGDTAARQDSLTQASPSPTPEKKDVNEVFKDYWKDFNFQDTLSLKQGDQLEQRFVNYIALFPKVAPDSMQAGVKAMLSAAAAEPQVLQYFLEKYDHYLYNPSSPLRNDLYYEPVLSFLVGHQGLDASTRSRYSTLLKLLQKNMPGNSAADFPYVDRHGKKLRLSAGATALRLLVFYDPGCQHCAEIIESLRSSAAINAHIDAKQFEVLAICPVGDEATWKAYDKSIPATWANGFDYSKAVIEGERYDVKAFPTLYLLDEDNKVLLKDVDWQQVDALLRNHRP